MKTILIMSNKIFTIVNQIIYYSNHPTPAEIVTAIITGLSIGIMLGVWLYENDINSWDKFKNKLKENKKNHGHSKSNRKIR